MDLFNFDLAEIARDLLEKAEMFDCSLKEAFETHVHPSIKGQIDFEEIEQFIENRKL